MNIKGLDPLRKHVPDFNSPIGVVRILSLPIVLVILVTAILSSGWFAKPAWLLVGEIGFGSLGFFLMYRFVHFKDDFKARFGPLAYQHAAGRFGYPGVAIIAAVVAHIRSLPGAAILLGPWAILLPGLGWVFIGMGVLLFVRVMQIFGIDNLVMLYVYFPEESHLVDHKIYHMLRHPAYAAAQWIAFGLALLNGGWLALACALSFALGLWAWVHWVEEKELIERFGSSYAAYREQVPPFWPRGEKMREFFGLLILGR